MKKNFDNVKRELEEVLGTKKFLVLFHYASSTRMVQGSDAQYESYGLLRLGELLLDSQSVETLRAAKAAKEEPASGEDYHQEQIDDPNLPDQPDHTEA